MEAQRLQIEGIVPIFLAGTFLLTADQVVWPLKSLATLLLAAYACVVVLARDAPGHERAVHRGKLTLLLGLILCLAVLPTLNSIQARQQQGLHTNAHDGVLQVETAMRFTLEGRNPYVETYEGTPLERWDWGHSYPNPAIYYFVYLPFMFLSGLPLYVLSLRTLGWYDQRFVFLLAFAAALWAFARLAKDRSGRLLALALVGLNPLSLPSFVEGRNDIMILTLLGLSLWALSRAEWRWRFLLSGALFGLACATKQTVWFFAPFYGLYVWGRWGGREGKTPSRADLAAAFRNWAAPVALAALATTLPYLLWSPSSLWEDTVSYLSGNVEHNYPIKTYNAYGLNVVLASPGFGRLLDSATSGPLAGLQPVAKALTVRSELQSYPFWIYQLLLAGPLFVLALRRQWRRNTISVALAGYAASMLVYQYCSRLMHSNYIGFLATIFALAYLLREPMPAGEEDGERGEPVGWQVR